MTYTCILYPLDKCKYRWTCTFLHPQSHRHILFKKFQQQSQRRTVMYATRSVLYGSSCMLFKRAMNTIIQPSLLYIMCALIMHHSKKKREKFSQTVMQSCNTMHNSLGTSVKVCSHSKPRCKQNCCIALVWYRKSELLPLQLPFCTITDVSVFVHQCWRVVMNPVCSSTGCLRAS